LAGEEGVKHPAFLPGGVGSGGIRHRMPQAPDATVHLNAVTVEDMSPE